MKNTLPIPTLTVEQFRQQYFQPSPLWRQLFLSRASSFLIHKVEDFRHLIRFPLPPHRKVVHDFVLLTKGFMQRSKGLENYNVEAGSVFFLPARQITSNNFVSEDACGYYGHFEPAMLPQKRPGVDHNGFPFLELTGSPLVHIPPDQMLGLLALLEKMEREYQSQATDRYELIAACLHLFLMELRRYRATDPPAPAFNAAQILTQRFRNALWEHSGKKYCVADYADLLAVSPNHLNKCVRQTTGRAASTWLAEMILLESQVLLAQTDLSIAQVAAAAGMEDQSYFGRFFRKKTGFTPTGYRKWIEKSEILRLPS